MVEMKTLTIGDTTFVVKDGEARNVVNTHNADNSSHNDIRLLIGGLTSRFNALANSDDTTMDQLSELVEYIKANRSLIESITTNKVNVSDIINNLTTNASNKPLSAAQGVILKGLIDAIEIPTVPTNVSAFENDKGYITDSELNTAVENSLNEAKESGEFDGSEGERGFSVLRVTTALSSYTTATGGFTPKYRIALSTVLSESGVDKVLIGDTILRNYYTYPVGYVDSSYVYVGAYSSIRGSAGSSVTISSTTESEESGGENVVTFSDGNTLTVNNGKDGETPVKGTHYFTEADKQELKQDILEDLDNGDDSTVTEHNKDTTAHSDIRQLLNQLSTNKANKSDLADYVKSVNGELPDESGNVKITVQAEQPNFVDSVEQMTDTTKAYVLKETGEIWTWQSYQTEATVKPNFTNLYNKNDVQVNMAYVTVNSPASAVDGCYKMGLISYDFSNYDVANPVTVRIKGKFDVGRPNSRLVYFRSSDLSAEKFRAYQQFNAHIGYTTEADGTIAFPLVVKKDGSNVHSEYKMFRAFSFSNYVSSSAITMANVPDDLIITINEPITYTEIPAQTVYEWRSTGMSYNATDYEPRIIALEEDVETLKEDVNILEKAIESVADTSSVRHKHQDNAVNTIVKLNNSTTFSENGITFVGDELWVMKDDTAYTNGTRIFRYYVDGNEFTYLGYIDGDFGHLNTMDYCEANDCFIFGNGGNDTNTDGNYFVVIKNPLSLGYAETVTIDELVSRGQAVKYDLDSTIGSIGFKVQALWGDSNLGDNNIAVLIASNTQTIKFVLLTKTNGEFDGGLIVLRSFTNMATFGVQDCDIWGDTLYIGGQGTVGNPGRYLICEVSLTDPTQRKIIARDFYQEDGTALTGCVQGVYVDHDYIWIATNAASTTGKAVALTKYRK